MPVRSESAVMNLAMRPVSVTCRQHVHQFRNLQAGKMQVSTARPAVTCGQHHPGPQGCASLQTSWQHTRCRCWWLEVKCNQTLQLHLGDLIISLPNGTCVSCGFYPNTVITAVCHFKIKYNLPGLENIILLSAACSRLIDAADPCMKGVSLRLPLLHFHKAGFVL